MSITFSSGYVNLSAVFRGASPAAAHEVRCNADKGNAV